MTNSKRVKRILHLKKSNRMLLRLVITIYTYQVSRIIPLYMEADRA